MNRLIKGIQHFQHEVFPQKRALFQRLAAGQNPETLMVACSDSRVCIDLLTQAEPGDLFVCRDAGNIVPCYGQGDAVSASIEYALAKLPIRDIVVCGHSDCGAMKGLLHPQALEQMPDVRTWLACSQGAYRALEAGGVDGGSPEALELLTKLNVRLQLEHLRSYPQVFAQLRRTLQLHGWFYRIDTGEVEEWDALDDAWTPLQPALSARVARGVAANQEVRHA
jgi:carbonic anhydrase